MKTTGNLGLKKPDGTDIVDITDLNGNMDTLDTAVKAVQDHAVDGVKHITAAERTAWNAKASTVAATSAAAGLMAAADKAKLDGVAAGANNYVHPNHTGDVTSTGDGVTAIAPGVIVNADINAAAAIDATKIGTGAVSNAEFGYLDGVTGGIQGQLNGKANMANTPQQTTADITYYVRMDGNDGNTGLGNTAGGAFRTIGKAISSIPPVINHTVYINIAAGTYAETLNMGGFNGAGKIYINNGISALSTSYNIQSLRIINSGVVVSVSGLNAQTTTTNAFMVESCSNVEFYYCQATAATATYHGFVAHSSKLYTYACRTSNKYVGFYAGQNSNVLVWSADGMANKVALLGAEGGVLSYNGTYPIASTISDINAQNSGSVTSGVINPWGDNTTAVRSAVRTWINNGHSLIGGAFTKLQFNGIIYDQQGEYSTTLYRFTAKKTGIYLISGALNTAANTQASNALVLSAWINGARSLDIGTYAKSGAIGNIFVQGARVARLNAGDYVELYAYIDIGTTVLPGDGVTSDFNVIQIA